MTTSVSCVIPAFNAARHIRDAIDSALRQTHPPIEVIVVDDGSTDGTCSVVARYNRQVRCISQGNAGPSAARNAGITAAHGEFIAFLDADDLWDPNKLERQLAHFAAHSQLAVSIAQARFFWDHEVGEEEARFRARGEQDNAAFPGSTMVAQRRCFDQVGLLDPLLTHRDLQEWLMRAAERGLAHEIIPDVLAARRLHRTNMSRSTSADRDGEYLRLVKALLDKRRLSGGAAHVCVFETLLTARQS